MAPWLDYLSEVRSRMTRLLHLRPIIAAIAISFLYVGSWAVVSLTAQHHREADFFSNRSVSWVNVGAWRFEPSAFDRFMGTFYHPLALVLLGAPTALVTLLGLLVLAGLAAGAIANRNERRAAAQARREAMRFALEKKRIDSEANRPLVIQGGGGRSGTSSQSDLLVVCDHCRTRFNLAHGECPSCGKPHGVTA